jgi:hypothetical protein
VSENRFIATHLFDREAMKRTPEEFEVVKDLTGFFAKSCPPISQSYNPAILPRETLLLVIHSIADSWWFQGKPPFTETLEGYVSLRIF